VEVVEYRDPAVLNSITKVRLVVPPLGLDFELVKQLLRAWRKLLERWVAGSKVWVKLERLDQLSTWHPDVRMSVVRGRPAVPFAGLKMAGWNRHLDQMGRLPNKPLMESRIVDG
jgi:hypothetical protein